MIILMSVVNEISDPRFREDRFQKGIVCLLVDASEYE